MNEFDFRLRKYSGKWYVEIIWEDVTQHSLEVPVASPDIGHAIIELFEKVKEDE